tara:strand:- start:620 stop:748 length:129 start_codon:yes stop_codon:yes gene_type:complete
MAIIVKSAIKINKGFDTWAARSPINIENTGDSKCSKVLALKK